VGMGDPMTRPRVVICSLWRNDAGRQLEERVDHLLSKTSAELELRWLWITGDNEDNTAELLRLLAGEDVELLEADTGIAGEDIPTRRRRLSVTASRMFEAVRQDDELVVLHESDLLTAATIVDELAAALELAGWWEPADGANAGAVVAGWPVIDIGNGDQFYDVWAYRDLEGRPFGAHRAKPAELLEVTGLGSVWMAPAELVRGRRMEERCVLDLCEQWRAAGVRLYAAPDIEVRQPRALWAPP
jgi:hypothetical protein